FACRHAHRGDQSGQGFAIRRIFQVLDHARFDAGVADQRQRVARSTAGGVVVDGDVLRGHAMVLAGVEVRLPSKRCNTSPSAAPSSSAATNAGTCAGEIPAKLSLNMRPNATAGLAKAVDAVNQYAAPIQAATIAA